MQKYLLLIFMLVGGLASNIVGQDIQYTQFYAAPMYLNPGLAGMTGDARVGANYRTQWPLNYDAPYTTMSLYGDYLFSGYNSGLGAMVTRDAPNGGLSTMEVAIQYAYRVKLYENKAKKQFAYFSPGIHLGYSRWDLDYSKFTTPSMWDGTTYVRSNLPSELSSVKPIGIPDLGLGGILYTNTVFFGASVYHINRPNQSFSGDAVQMYMKTSVHMGYKYSLPMTAYTSTMPRRRLERSLYTVAHYKQQGKFNQFDVGMYLNWEPIMLGVYYRGFPDPVYESFNESAILLFGVKFDEVRIAYSFDITMSNVSMRSGGAHEISVQYVFPIEVNKRPQSIPCPDFSN